LSISASSGTPPKTVNALSRPENQAADLDEPLAEVDLKLTARRSLEPHRRQRLGLQRLPVGLHGPLQSSQADGDPLLGDQILTHHVGVAAVADEPLA